MELNASTTDRVELNKLKEQFNYAFDAVYGVQKTAYFSKRTAYILFGLGYLAYCMINSINRVAKLLLFRGIYHVL